MIPQPQGFTLVVEPVDREKIEALEKELNTTSGFGQKTIAGYDVPCLLQVVAAGPGVEYDQQGGGFLRNHIHAGDKILGTISEMNIAKDFLNPKEHWEFDGKKYLVVNSRDYHNITGPALFVVECGHVPLGGSNG